MSQKQMHTIEQVEAAAEKEFTVSFPNTSTLYQRDDLSVRFNAEDVRNAFVDGFLAGVQFLSSPVTPYFRLERLLSAMNHVQASGHAGSAIMDEERIINWARDIGWKEDDFAELVPPPSLEQRQRDWSTRVIDAWALRWNWSRIPAPELRGSHWTMLGMGLELSYLNTRFDTPDAARFEAARLVYNELTEEAQASLGPCPLEV